MVNKKLLLILIIGTIASLVVLVLERLDSFKDQYANNDVFIGALLVFSLFFIFCVQYLLYIHKNKRVTKKIQLRSQHDPSWNTDTLYADIQQLFLVFQKAWQEMDRLILANITTPTLFSKVDLCMELFTSMHRRDFLEKITVQELWIVDSTDTPTIDGDLITIEISATAYQTVFENNVILYSRTKKFSESWNCIRIKGKWVIDSIEHNTTQPLEKKDIITHSSSIVFANKLNFYYDAAFGDMFLPNKGYLLGGNITALGMVTNHIIGRYRSRIVSFYTFVMRPTSKYETEKTYIVLQVMLPKKYTHIFVRPTTSLTALRISRAMPSSLEKHTFESMGFNEQYDIYSHPDDALSSFELIEPQFMELLMNMQNKYSFEVVDTILYFYAVHSPQVIADDYDELFTILNEAFKRMER